MKSRIKISYWIMVVELIVSIFKYYLISYFKTTMIEKPLRKPQFTTIDKLSRGRSGYNIYAKVIEATLGSIITRDGQNIPKVQAIIADQTAAARAFFKGDNAKLIQKGNVIAIRNGVKKIIKNKISLEVDLFGRVTP